MNPIKFDAATLGHAQSKSQEFVEITEESSKRATHAMMTEALPVLTMYFPDFSAKYGSEDEDTVRAVMREYAHQLIKNKVTTKMLRVGLERLRKQSTTMRWSPNPQQFAELCLTQPEDVGLPEVEEAIHQVTEARGRFKGQPYTFSHPVVEMLNKQAGYQMYDMKRNDWYQLVKQTYALLTKQMLNGEVQLPEKALEHKPAQVNTELHDEINRRGAEIIEKRAKDPLISRIAALREGAKS